ncbi:hypothetical protein GSI_14766 [Ganoderma sinense ZZ0214-1]|uniref:Uncharacterized protein n=1 Tax=Ganoderma sinense ZZ0214-1 TaxID=1077348 RepID=A0A2G8RPK7_9APHY|nr:hypothetical protein GSI_14766 [Ganoderma sinense ZZ0214-1]
MPAITSSRWRTRPRLRAAHLQQPRIRLQRHHDLVRVRREQRDDPAPHRLQVDLLQLDPVESPERHLELLQTQPTLPAPHQRLLCDLAREPELLVRPSHSPLHDEVREVGARQLARAGASRRTCERTEEVVALARHLEVHETGERGEERIHARGVDMRSVRGALEPEREACERVRRGGRERVQELVEQRAAVRYGARHERDALGAVWRVAARGAPRFVCDDLEAVECREHGERVQGGREAGAVAADALEFEQGGGREEEVAEDV